jgi:hypothetical protein
MRIRETHMQIERLIPDVSEEFTCTIRHPLWTPTAPFHILIVVRPRINGVRLHVHLPDNPCRVTGFRQRLRDRRHVRAGMQIVDPVTVPVLTVRMAVVTGQDIRPAGGAGRRRAERVGKPGSSLCQRINVRGLDDRAPETACDRAPVISDQEKDVAVF